MFRYYKYSATEHRYYPITDPGTCKELYIPSDTFFQILSSEQKSLELHSSIFNIINSTYVLIPFSSIYGQNVILECTDIQKEFQESLSKHTLLGGSYYE